MHERVFTLDRFTRTILTVITALLAVIAVELWFGRPNMVPAARAQIPDSGKQRHDLLREQKRTSDLLKQVLDHIRTKPIKVRIDATDKQAVGSAGR